MKSNDITPNRKDYAFPICPFQNLFGVLVILALPIFAMPS